MKFLTQKKLHASNQPTSAKVSSLSVQLLTWSGNIEIPHFQSLQRC